MIGLGIPLLGGGGNAYLKRARMAGLSLGGVSAGTFLTETGLIYTRVWDNTANLDVSVQTSSSTISMPITGADVACVGTNGVVTKGVVCQPKCRNYLPPSNSRNVAAAGWTSGGAATHSYPGGTGPDGQNKASFVTIAAGESVGQYAQLNNVAVGRKVTQSAWGSSATVGFQQGSNLSSATSVGWGRLSHTDTSASGSGNNVFYAISAFGSPGVSQLVDCFQDDGQEFLTEYMNGGGSATIRYNDRFSWSSGFVDSDGSISYYIKFQPKHSTTHTPYIDATTISAQTVQPYQMLWGFGTAGSAATDYVRINIGSGTAWHIEIAQGGGAGVQTTNAMSWAAQDVVEIFVKAGGGVASVAKYAVNGGTWTDLVPASTMATYAPSANALFVAGESNANNTTAAMWAWIQEIAIFRSGHRPPGV